MGIFRSAAHKSILPVLALLTMANAGLFAQETDLRVWWGANGLNSLADATFHPQRVAIAISDSIYSSQWFGALSVLFVLVAAVGVLWLRFVGAQKREKELRDLVKQKTADLQKANEELFFLSFTDPLTGLCNRRLFDQSMEKECARIQRMNSYGSLLSIDVDSLQTSERLSRTSEGRRVPGGAGRGADPAVPAQAGHGRPLRRRGVCHDSAHHQHCRCHPHRGDSEEAVADLNVLHPAWVLPLISP